MPEKEGAEEKTTKSVVSKRQKQMMGEEGYDIARDMGKVRPSNDKKDATTMPPSKEMEKTRKVNKGPSALDIVKKKYKGQIMNVEELDLTKVAESFGGYIVEAPVEDREEKKNRAAKRLAKAAGINIRTQGPEQAAATQAFKDMRMSRDKRFSNLTPDVKSGMRATAAGKGKDEPKRFSSTKGGLKGTILTPGPENAARSAIETLRRKDQQKQGRINRKKEDSPKKPTATRADYPKTRAELEAKRKEYEIDRQGNVTDAGVEKFARRSLNRKQIASGSNVPIELTKKDLDTAREKMVGGTEVKDSSGKVIGKTTGKYGGRLSRKAPAPGAGRKPRMNFDDFMDQMSKMSPEQKRETERKYGEKILNQPGLDSTAEREAQRNISARDKVRSQAGQKERRIAGDPPESPKPPRSTGGIKDTLTNLERRQQQSLIGRTGGLLAKTLNPALAGVEAMQRYQRGDVRGARISAIQSIGGPIGFGAGVINALRKQTEIPTVDPNKVQVTGDVLKKPDPTPSEFKKLKKQAKKQGVELDKPDQPRKKSDPKSDAGAGGGKKPPKRPTTKRGDSGEGGGTERNLTSKAVGDATEPILSYQAFRDLGQGTKKVLDKIGGSLSVKKNTKTGRISAGQ